MKLKYGCGKRLPPEGFITKYCGAGRGLVLCEDCQQQPINRRWLRMQLRLWWKSRRYWLKSHFGPYKTVFRVDATRPLVTEHQSVQRWPDWLFKPYESLTRKQRQLASLYSELRHIRERD